MYLQEVIQRLIKDKDKLTIGEAVRKLRKARKWQQKYLSQLAGISNSYLCDIEKNRTTPSIKTMEKLGENLLDGVEDYNWQFFLQFNYVKNGRISKKE
jgi:transcriptional regulator with XRE-family HTH domain